MRVQIPGWGYLEMIATVLLPISFLLLTIRIEPACISQSEIQFDVRPKPFE